MSVVALAETRWWKRRSFSEQNKDVAGPVETHGLSELSPPLPGNLPSSWLCLRWAEDSSTHSFWVAVLWIGLPGLVKKEPALKLEHNP